MDSTENSNQEIENHFVQMDEMVSIAICKRKGLGKRQNILDKGSTELVAKLFRTTRMRI
jgi:hypothetical protein